MLLVCLIKLEVIIEKNINNYIEIFIESDLKEIIKKGKKRNL